MRVVNWVAVNKVADALEKAPYTIPEIAKLGAVTERTAYRWLDLMMESGSDLIRRSRKGESETYQILP